jgi:hypothetical protein
MSKKRFKSIDDIRRFIAGITNDLNDNKFPDEMKIKKVRALGYLANVMLDVLKSSSIEDRVNDLEKRLNGMVGSKK